jgi:hypothetical protein
LKGPARLDLLLSSTVTCDNDLEEGWRQALKRRWILMSFRRSHGADGRGFGGIRQEKKWRGIPAQE